MSRDSMDQTSKRTSQTSIRRSSNISTNTANDYVNDFNYFTNDRINDSVDEAAAEKIIMFFKMIKNLSKFFDVSKFMKLVPKEIDVKELCKIIPRVGKLLFDKTININVKFRLAGETWPPFILYKIIIRGLNNFEFSHT